MDIAKSNSVCCGTLKITNWGTGLAHWASPGSPNARPRFKIAPKDIYNATSPWFSSSFPIFSPLSLQIKAKMKDFKKKKICPVAQWATLIYQNSQVMQLFSYILCITDFILPQLPHGGFFFLLFPVPSHSQVELPKKFQITSFFYIAHLDRSYSNVSKAKK